ncbi:hypothetical protein COOONC_13661 [Cooperia oncophora]
MFFSIVCALLLLSTITSEAQVAAPCVDQGGEDFCMQPYKLGFCKKPSFAQQLCAKTCGTCH